MSDFIYNGSVITMGKCIKCGKYLSAKATFVTLLQDIKYCTVPTWPHDQT